MVAPIVEELADEFPEVKVYKVDVDENQELALANKVASIPTFLLYKDGEVIKKIVGAVSKSELIQAIRQVSVDKNAVQNACKRKHIIIR